MKRFPVITWCMHSLAPQWTLITSDRLPELLEGMALYYARTRG